MKRIQRIAGYSLLASSVFLANAALGEDTAALEEVVITGSYIKGSPNDAPSPIQTLTREDIVQSGVSDMAELIRNLAIASGSDTAPSDGARYNGAAGSGLANVNLRGLGPTSTLVLVDGKRLPFAGQKLIDGDRFVDINSIPVTMLERVEVLKDGGSATYGSDAIAGVVNFITRDEFVGFELTGKFQDVTKGDQTDATYGAIFGWESEDSKTHIVVGGEIFDRSQQDASDRKDLLRDQYDKQDVGATAIVSFVDVLFAPASLAAFDQGDLNCEDAGFDFSDAFGAGQQAITCNRGQNSTNILTPEQQRESFMVTGKHTFSDAVEVYGQASYYHGRSGSSNPVFAGPLSPKFVFPDLNGAFSPAFAAGDTTAGGAANNPYLIANGGNILGGSTLPARVDFILRAPGIDPQRNYDAGNDSVTTRYQFGVRGDFEIAGKDWSYDVSAVRGESRYQTRFLGINKDNLEMALYGLGGEGCVANGAASLEEVAAKDISDLEKQFLGQAVSGARLAASGFDGVITGDANPGLAAFNIPDLEPTLFGLIGNVEGLPFINPDNFIRALTSSNQGVGDCQFLNTTLSRADNPNLANSDELLRWIETPVHQAQKSETFLDTYDIVFSGELFDMEAGPVSMAVGYQHRKEGRKTATDPIFTGTINSFGQAQGNEAVGGLGENKDYDEDRGIDAVFFEFQVPILDNLDAQIAGRYEDYGGNIGSTFDPKLGLRWQATEDWVLRGSVGTSFRGPSLAQINEGTGFSFALSKDFLDAACVRTGQCDIPSEADAESVIHVKQGFASPGLKPETATTFNFGAIWTAPEGTFEGLTVGVDYYNIKFEDKISELPTQAILGDELAKFIAARDEVDEFDNAVNFINVNSSGADFGQSCNPDLFAAGSTDCQVNPALYSILTAVDGANITRRADETRSLQIVGGDAINTGEVQTSGIDLNWSYLWDNDLGSWNFAGNVSHVIEFKYSKFPVGIPDFDAAGSLNADAAKNGLSRSMPDLRGNTTLSFLRGNHSAGLTMRFIGGYEDDNVAERRLENNLDAYYAFDFRYTYSWLVGDSNVELTLGAIDLFEADVPELKNERGTDLTAFDRRGRRIYASATYRM